MVSASSASDPCLLWSACLESHPEIFILPGNQILCVRSLCTKAFTWNYWTITAITGAWGCAFIKKGHPGIDSTAETRGGSVAFLLLGLFLWSLVWKLKYIPATTRSDFKKKHPTGTTMTRKVPEQKNNILLGLFQSTLYAFPKMPETKINTDGTWQIPELFSTSLQSMFISCNVLKKKPHSSKNRVQRVFLPVFPQA